MSTPAKCLPCATALGATWDTELIEEVGFKLLSNEAKRKAASVILAPTVNIQRVIFMYSIRCFFALMILSHRIPWEVGWVHLSWALYLVR